ncbi:MAG: YhbY family RNA-binding protein [Desulfobacterales bacterium]
MLKGFQKKYLKALAHGLKPVVFIGQNGLSPSLAKAMNSALNTHELIKVRFIDFKEKDQKEMLASEIEKIHSCQKVGMVGHIVIFYRMQKDPKKRKIVLQEKTTGNVE